MKTCKICKLEKELICYFKDRGLKDGHASMCKDCKTKATYEWREKNKEYYNKTMRDYRASRSPTERRDIDLKRWFALPYGWYDATLKSQGNKCAICRKLNTSTKRCFAVDHDHKTGKVRGIVCYNCNRLLNAFDNVDLFKALCNYVNKHKEYSE